MFQGNKVWQRQQPFKTEHWSLAEAHQGTAVTAADDTGSRADSFAAVQPCSQLDQGSNSH